MLPGIALVVAWIGDAIRTINLRKFSVIFKIIGESVVDASWVETQIRIVREKQWGTFGADIQMNPEKVMPLMNSLCLRRHSLDRILADSAQLAQPL